MKKILCIIAVTLMGVAAIFAQSPNYQGIIYVTPTGAGTHSGDSWANATSSIADAQTIAQAHNAMVWVAAGTYYGSETDTTAFRTVSGVNVYGGFAGNESANFNLSHRDFNAHQTILDGRNQRRVLTADNAYWDGFTIQNGFTSWSGGGVWMRSNSRLANCKIKNNTATGNGGGIYAQGHYNNNVRISDCEINNNVASIGGGCYLMAYDYYDAGPMVFVDSCLISNNTATQSSGGVYCYLTQLSNCEISDNTAQSCGGVNGVHSAIASCDISSNQASYSAGGIFADYYTNVTNTSISNNVLNADSYSIANYGDYYLLDGSGGMKVRRNCTIVQCECYNNTINLHLTTMGIYIYCGTGLLSNNSDIRCCNIHHNHILNTTEEIFPYGSIIIASTLANSNIHDHDTSFGLMAYSSTVSNTEIYDNSGGMAIINGNITNSHIYRNREGSDVRFSTAQSCVFDHNGSSESECAGIYATEAMVNNCVITSNTGGAGSIISATKNTTISNCLISNNSAYYGVVVNLSYDTISTTNIVNSTVVNNVGDIEGGIGGNCARMHIENSIIFGNLDRYGCTTNISHSGEYGAHCSYSAIEGGYAGEHNIDISGQPLFVNPSLTAGAGDSTGNVDWHLLPNAVCINQGSNSFVTDSTDLDGLPRIACDVVDMGCYEFYRVHHIYQTVPASYTWHGNTYTESGNYPWLGLLATHCDSLEVLHLTVGNVGIDNPSTVQEEKMRLYPNPTTGVVNVQFTNHNSPITYIQVFDIYGKLVGVVETCHGASLQTGTGASAQTKIDLSRYANGVYFIKAVADGRVIGVRKVVKQ